MADFQKIRQEIPIEKVARWLGIEVLSGKAKCPFHNDQTPSMSFKEGRFKCFGCDASGDAIDLVARLKNLSTTEAAQKITEVFHIHNSAPVQRKHAAMNYAPITEYIDQCIEAFAVAPAAQMYLQRRGFIGESMLRFRFGFDPKTNAIVIPYGTKAEYYTARSITDKRFFKPRTEDAGPEPLFYEESLDQDASVFVVESAFCALSIMQAGGHSVATCGTGTRKLVDAIKAREIVPPVIVCMDRDSAGDEAAMKLCTQLKAQGVTHLRATTPEGYKDPNELLMGDSGLFRAWVQGCVDEAKKLPREQLQNENDRLPQAESLQALHPELNPRYLNTDIGNSRLFSDYYSGVARYVPERKLWYIFSGKRWEPDIAGLKAMELCKTLANELMVYAFHISDEQQRKEYIDRCKKWQTRRTRETILKDAQGVYPIPMEAFDADPFLFNCQNGTMHLKDMTFRPHEPEDKLTKISDVVYDPSARCVRFDAFVDEIMSGDQDRARFLQRSLGYALSGDTRFECLFILYGATTRNGRRVRSWRACLKLWVNMEVRFGLRRSA